jgi:polyphosphate:AMP phosphotransferase
MDPRHLQVHALGGATDEESQRPPMWRYWRRLPPRGKIGVFFGSWYTAPVVDRVLGGGSGRALDAAMDEVRRFETMLAREGALVLKYWFHLSKRAQKARLTELASSRATRWRVTAEDWERAAHYNAFRRASERALRATSTDDAPWTVVDARDARHRALFVGDHLNAALEARLAATNGARGNGATAARRATRVASAPAPKSARRAAAVADAGEPAPTIESMVDLGKKLDHDGYEAELARWQERLALLTRKKRFRKLSPVLVFEGVDAAGKGGAIRRVTRAVDARMYDIIPIAAPSDEERAQPYLWRFWRHVPRDGKFAIFDRSWYGRVLVERVEGFAAEADWRRAYDEINDFEAQLERAGCPVVKFWLQISKDEQLRRFKEREDTRWKRFKITAEDWRNRDKWDAYAVAAADMVAETSTKAAPWILVPAEDKHYARIMVLRATCAAIKAAL